MNNSFILNENTIAICIRNIRDEDCLTLGKQYVIQETYHNIGVYVVDDNGTYEMYDYGNFLPIEMYRECVIDDILN